MTAMSFGSMSFDGGRTEQAASASVRLHFTRWLSAAIAPSFVFATEPGLGGATIHESGLSDMPVELAASFAPAWALSPAFNFAMSATLPVGDTATGLGAGQIGYAGSASLSLSPASWFSVHGGAGRSLSDFSIQGTLDGSASVWGYAGAGFALPGGFWLGADYDADLGAYDPAFGRSTSTTVGLGIPAASLGSVTIDVAHGLTGPTPTWGFALRVGVDYVGLASAAWHAPSQDVVGTFGGGPHGLPVTPHDSTATATGKGTGTTTGTGSTTGTTTGSNASTTGSTQASTHGRGRQP